MSLRLRRHLPAFALATVAASLAAVVPVAAVALATSPADATAAPTSGLLRYPEHRASKDVMRAHGLGERAAEIALGAVGIPYRWGGESPSSGFDCSGLVRWAYGRIGIELPHNSYALYGVGRRVPRADMQPGDVLFFSGLGHVGLFLGDGRMVHAPYSGKDVEVVRLSTSHYGSRLVGARRVSSG